MNIPRSNFKTMPKVIRRHIVSISLRFKQSTLYDRGSVHIFGRRTFSDAEMQEAVEYLSKAVNPFDRKVEFHRYTETGEIYVKVVNPITGEIIRRFH